jgi:hypothetical protein
MKMFTVDYKTDFVIHSPTQMDIDFVTILKYDKTAPIVTNNSNLLPDEHKVSKKVLKDQLSECFNACNWLSVTIFDVL